MSLTFYEWPGGFEKKHVITKRFVSGPFLSHSNTATICKVGLSYIHSSHRDRQTDRYTGVVSRHIITNDLVVVTSEW